MEGSTYTPPNIEVCSGGSLMESLMEYILYCFGPSFRDFLNEHFELVKVASSHRGAKVFAVPKYLATYVRRLERERVKVLASGILLGWVWGGEFVPMAALFELARTSGFRVGCAVLAREQGVKAFLYGNDLLLVSFSGFLQPVKRDLLVGVLSEEDLHAVGVGKLCVDPQDVERMLWEGRMLDVIVRNVMDLGLFIRDEGYFD